MLSVSSSGEVSASGLSGRVNAAGIITWDTPNALYFTTGLIANAKMSAMGTLMTSGVTTMTRLDAFNNSAVTAPNADPVLDSMIWVNPTPFGGTLQSVIYQSNQFVAVGGGGMAAISTDGRAWQTRTSPSRRMMTGLTYGKGLYVAVGEGEAIITSPDALNWTLRGTASVAKFDLAAVAFGNNRFLAVGGVGTSYYSDDGIVWQARPAGIVFVDVKFINGKFVILGYNPGGGASVFTSTDGVTWSAGSPLASVVASRGIAFGNGKYLVGGIASDGFTRIFQSTDASVWTMNPNLVAGGVTNSITFKNLTFNNGKFMAFDGSNFSYTSTDGVAWQRGKSVSRQPKATAFGGGAYVTVGETISTSSDGVSWADQVSRRHVPHINFVGGGVYAGQGGHLGNGVNNSGSGVTNDLYSAVPGSNVGDYYSGEDGFLRYNGIDYFVEGRERLRGSVSASSAYLLYGDKGSAYLPKITTVFTNNTSRFIITNFVRLPTGTTAELLGHVLAFENLFLVGRGGTIIRTTAYTNWVPVASGTTADLYSGAKASYSNAPAVIVGDQGTILTSLNGTAWTKRASGTTEKLLSVSYQQVSVFATNPVYCAVGENGTVLVSSNLGTSWSIVATNNFGRKIRSVSAPLNASASLSVAGEYGLVAGSNDRTNWFQSSLEADLTGAVHGNGRWAVVGPYYCLTSLDGVRWDFHSFKYGGGAMKYGGGKFVVATTSGVVTSPDAINWTDAYTGPAAQNLNLAAVAYGAGRWAVVGYSKILISADGHNWSPTSVSGSTFFNDVLYANGIWVSVGANGSRAYSTNGIIWTPNNSNPNDVWRAVTYGKGLWVSVGSSGILSTSTNGINWTLRSQNGGYSLADVEIVGDRFIAIGSSSNTNLALVSSNGTNWTSTGLPVQPTLRSLTAANGSLLMVGNNGTILQGSYPVTGLPAISVTPSTNLFVTAGNVMTLKATVSGLAPFQFLWSRNGIPLVNGSRISGATADTLSVTVQAEEDGGDYTVEVINAVGSRVSFPVNVTVAAPPTFLTQPLSQTALLGGKATFSASAKGTGVTYQWLKNGSVIAGQTNAALTLNGLLAADAGAYSVVASNSNGPRTSAVAVLSVSALPTFSVDAAFPGSSLTFSNWPGYQNTIWTILPLADGTRLIGGTFKIQSGTSVSTGLARLNADGTVDNSFTPPALFPSQNLNFHGAVRTILPLPDGRFLLGGDQTTGKGLVLIKANGTLDAPLDLSFVTSGGAPYITSLALQADGKIVMCGSFVLNGLFNLGRLKSDLTLDSAFGLKTFQLVPTEASSIAVQADQKLIVVGPGIIRLEPTGLKDLNFLQSVGSYILSTVVMPDGRIAVAGQNIVASGRTNIIMLDSSGAVDGSFKANANGSVYSLLKLPDDSLVAGGLFGTINNLPVGQVGLIRKDGTVDANFKINLGSGGIAYALAVEPSGAILIGGTFKTVNGIPATNFARLTSTPSSVALAIVSQPQSASADIGDTLAFGVAASGGAPLTYQWRKNGAALMGATQSSLVLTSVSTNDVANYTVVVTDPSGSTTSQLAALTVAGIAPVVPVGGFAAWTVSNNLPASASGPLNDPDGDQVSNIFEYYFGSNPSAANSGRRPQAASVNLNNQNYPAITFTRSKSASGVTAEVQISTKVIFTDSLSAIELSAVDLGDGTERVTVRSGTSGQVQANQFLRLRLVNMP